MDYKKPVLIFNLKMIGGIHPVYFMRNAVYKDDKASN